MKITKATQQARKTAVKVHVAQRQAQNAIAKAQLAAAYQAQFEERKAVDSNYKGYGKPRHAKAQQPNRPGYRAAGRRKGFRMRKQPKTPKPLAVKGGQRTEKHKRTQAAASTRIATRIQAGRATFAHAADNLGRTFNLPARHVTFTTPGGTQTVTGRDVRNAIFNSYHFIKNPVNLFPKMFSNGLQGSPNHHHRPLPNLKGEGTEFPVTNTQGGYHGGNPGKLRVIIQTKPNDMHKFKGLLAHDERRTLHQPGYNDHFQVKQYPRPAMRNRVVASLPFMRSVLNPEGAVGSATGY